MPLVKCEHCSREFERQVSWTKRRVFCNNACRSAASRIALTCTRCGKAYSRRKSEKPSKYCSRLCQNRSKGDARAGKPFPQKMRGDTLPCPSCGKLLHVRPCEQRNGRQKYCSQACYFNDKGRRNNTGRKWSDDVKAKMSNAARRRPKRKPKDRSRICLACAKSFQHLPGTYGKESQRFCSTACWYDWLRGNPWEAGNYIDGKTAERNTRGPNWRTQRKLALVRDGYTCVKCGDTERLLHVHHIVPWRAFFDDYIAANDLDNLLTLCNRCHCQMERFSVNLRRLLFDVSFLAVAA